MVSFTGNDLWENVIPVEEETDVEKLMFKVEELSALLVECSTLLAEVSEAETADELEECQSRVQEYLQGTQYKYCEY